MQTAQDILWLLILIGVMIMIHELGHFWAARYFDVKVETFSLGFGPRLFGFKRGETDYRVSLILFGGYVKMAGEQFAEMTAPARRAAGRSATAARRAKSAQQTALAASHHRLRRPFHELGAGRGHSGRPLHGQV